jgi:tetratricopeptide (TPR) repeat protein
LLTNHSLWLGLRQWDLGQFTQAATHMRQALPIRQKLVEEFPSQATDGWSLDFKYGVTGLLLVEMGQWAEAESLLRQTLSIRQKLADGSTQTSKHRDLAHSHFELGELLALLGQRGEAHSHYQQGLAILGKPPLDKVPPFPPRMAVFLHDLAKVSEQSCQRAEAFAYLDQTLHQLELARKVGPLDVWHRNSQNYHHRHLGQLLAELGRRAEAETHFRRNLADLERLAANVPAFPRFRCYVARERTGLGGLLMELGRWDEAEDQCRKALALQEELATTYAGIPLYLVERAETYATLGHLLRDRGKPQEALDWYAKAIAVLEPVLAKEKRFVPAREALCNTYWGRARALDLLRRHAEAAQDWERALALEDGPNRPVLQHGRAISQAHLSGDHRRALAEAEALAQDGDTPTLEGLARLCALASRLVEDADQREQYAARALTLLRQAVGKGYRDNFYLKEGADLAPLRQRADFRKLLAEAEVKGATRGP